MTLPSNRFENIDYGFRPESYWAVADPLQAILANVKGTERREMIRCFWKAGRIQEAPNWFLEGSLSEEHRAAAGRIHPVFMGGEYLPDFESEEVEIARIELKSTMADVTSIRARKRGKRILCSIVDEYESEFQVSPASSEKPLSLGELVDLIDSANDGESLATCFTIMNYESDEPSVEWLNELRSFTRVESGFYQQLLLHYEKVTDLWYEQEKRKIERSRET